MDTDDILQTLPAGAMAPVVDTEPPADAPPADATHTIEHRSFARASADEPMPVTTNTGN